MPAMRCGLSVELAVIRRTDTCDLFEESGKVFEVFVTDHFTYIHHGAVVIHQKALGALDSDVGQIVGKTLSGLFFEKAGKIGRVKTDHVADILQAQRLLKVFLDILFGQCDRAALLLGLFLLHTPDDPCDFLQQQVVDFLQAAAVPETPDQVFFKGGRAVFLL